MTDTRKISDRLHIPGAGVATVTGYKADLTHICGCSIQIVGATRDQLLQNLERHARDVHKSGVVSQTMKQELRRATREI